MPAVSPSRFQERLLDEILPDPDDIGSSAYRLLYAHTRTVVASALAHGDDPVLFLRSSLEEIEEELNRFARAILEANSPTFLGPGPESLVDYS